MLFSLHVAVEPSNIEGAGTAVLLSKLGGAPASIYYLYTTCCSLNGHVVPVLGSLFLASFEALRERKCASDRSSTKDQSAPEGPRLLCRALRPKFFIFWPAVTAGFLHGLRLLARALAHVHSAHAALSLLLEKAFSPLQACSANKLDGPCLTSCSMCLGNNS